ncbi:MAG: clan AA aspartic protease [Planctomycetes bacterium]|nr:clan AA aspartic protease [Planctomycetota bacterium]
MITGVVNADLEARVQLVVQNASGQSQTIEAVIDTGFNSFLTLPPALVGVLAFSWICHTQGYLADGSVHDFDVYGVTILWDGHLRTVETEAVDAQPLVGMSLLEGHELRVSVVNGGVVSISAFPAP